MSPRLEFEGLSKTFRDGRHVRSLWRDLTGTLNAGEMMRLTGASGSGKSTLLATLAGLDKSYTGRIAAFGILYGQASTRQLESLRAREFGYIFQTFGLVDFLNVFDNVSLGLLRTTPRLSSRQRTQVRHTLDRVGLWSHRNNDVRHLSGGEQQRVGIARAIVPSPRLLLADEPTANLDSTTSGALLDIMERMNREHGTTFVFSTHDPRVMERARRLITLVDGRIEQDVRHDHGDAPR